MECNSSSELGSQCGSLSKSVGRKAMPSTFGDKLGNLLFNISCFSYVRMGKKTTLTLSSQDIHRSVDVAGKKCLQLYFNAILRGLVAYLLTLPDFFSKMSPHLNLQDTDNVLKSIKSATNVNS